MEAAETGERGQRWVSPGEASKAPVGVHESTMTRWCQAGVVVARRLPSVGKGSKPRWRVLVDEHGFPVPTTRTPPAEDSPAP
jgi:hypothetical protein